MIKLLDVLNNVFLYDEEEYSLLINEYNNIINCVEE